jgi:hypothetical protein
MKNFIAGKKKTTKTRETIECRKWKWIGYVLRIDNTRICTSALTWQPGRKRKVRRPKTHGGGPLSRKEHI